MLNSTEINEISSGICANINDAWIGFERAIIKITHLQRTVDANCGDFRLVLEDLRQQLVKAQAAVSHEHVLNFRREVTRATDPSFEPNEDELLFEPY